LNAFAKQVFINLAVKTKRMLYILLIWLNATFLALVFGKATEFVLTRGRIELPITLSLLIGLVSLNLIVISIAIFSPITTTIQIAIEVVAALIFVVLLRNRVVNFVLPKLKFTWVSITLLVFFLYLLIYVCTKCYLPTSHYDEGLYYIQFVRWLQQYGFVNGLANLHHRFGFNSSWHGLAAFFDYPNTGYFFNDLNGLLFLLYTAYVFTRIIAISEGSRFFSDLVLVASWTALIYPKEDLVSIASHIFVNTISPDWASFIYVSLVIVLVLKHAEQTAAQKQYLELLIILLAAYCFTVKLVNVTVLLVPTYLIIAAMWSGAYQRAAGLLACSAAVILPWICSNVILSGYLVFPIVHTQITFLDWGVPQNYVNELVDYTRIWAKTNGRPDVYTTLSAPELLAYWFRHQSSFIQTVYVIMCGTWAALGLFFMLEKRRLNEKFFEKHQNHLLVCLTCILGEIFWLFNAPDFRFSASFILSGLFLGLALVLNRLKRWHTIVMLTIAFGCLVSLNGSHLRDAFLSDQFPVLTEIETEIQNGIRIPVSTDQCFDSPIPCTPRTELAKGHVLLRDSRALHHGFIIQH